MMRIDGSFVPPRPAEDGVIGNRHNHMKKSDPFRIYGFLGGLVLSVSLLFPFVSSATETNRIANPSFESSEGTMPSGWSQGWWGNLSASFSYPIAGYDGGKAASVTVSERENGDAKWYFDEVPVTAGEEYVFSDRSRSTVPTDVIAQFATENGSYGYAWLGSVSGTGEWTRFEIPFTVPDGMTKVTVFHVMAADGTLSVDDYLLSSVEATVPAPTLDFSADPTSIVSGSSATISWSATDAVSCVAVGGWTGTRPTSGSLSVSPESTTTYGLSCVGNGGTVDRSVTVTVGGTISNLIENPSLETEEAGWPLHWSYDLWGELSASFSYPMTGYDGGKAASVTVSEWKNGDAKWYFDEVPVTAGEEYVFSDRSRSTVPTDVIVQFLLDDGSYGYSWLGSVPGTGEWEPFGESFPVPSGAVSATVFHVIAAVGTLAVDDYSLMRAEPAPEFPEGMVTFSFDDGFRNIYQHAIPMLDAADIRSTQAIVTGFFGDPEYMTKAQVKSVAGSGHEIASHTRTHADLPTLSPDEAESEIAGSKADLLSLGIVADTLVYPFGTHDDATVARTKSAGYLGARSVRDGLNSPVSDPYRLRDHHVTSDVTFEDIGGWIDEAVAKKQWLILELHRQDADGGEFSNDPELLGRVISYVKSLDMRTVTLGEGIAMLGD